MPNKKMNQRVCVYVSRLLKKEMVLVLQYFYESAMPTLS
jgi:hypothetical protein